MKQTYTNIRILLLDNASTDRTTDIVSREYPGIRLIRKNDNIGIWARQEELLELDDAPYVLVLTDVMMDPHFIENGVRAMEAEPDAGAAQAKIYRADRRTDHSFNMTNIIDTVGFRISRALSITNQGHGEPDKGQFDHLKEVFGVEGAAPLFRRTALERCRIDGHIIDPDYRVGGIGYGDDVDIAWRMRLMGFKHIFVPSMVGWHDRSTTKDLASSAVIGRLSRIQSRRQIALSKRRLDWSNVRFTIIKNAYASNLLRHAPRIIAREVGIIGYTLLFEPGVFKEIGRFVRLLPKMLRRRKAVLQSARVSHADMKRWYI